MSYTAMYRRFRPTTFEEVKGQDAIVTTLKNQIRSDRIGHAYLFCGTRGTGKTSIAKLFAKSVNCEHPVDGSPCGECASCKAIAEGRSMNVIEIDAASNNGVDNIREIVNEVAYSPTEGKYRVYIIDEVHMLSAGAFNALLKTLEEPPSYVIFILATTEANKIPVTILSRCQRYDFKRLTVEQIEERMKEALAAAGEELPIEEKALKYLAKSADGAMRDAWSLLDQCLAFHFGHELTYDMVLDVLGAVDTSVFSKLLRCVIARDVAGCIGVLEEIVLQGRDMSQFVSDFTWYLRNLLLVKTSGDSCEEVIDISSENLARLKEEAQQIEVDAIMRDIRCFSELSGRIRYAGQKRVLIENGADSAVQAGDGDERRYTSGTDSKAGTDGGTDRKRLDCNRSGADRTARSAGSSAGQKGRAAQGSSRGNQRNRSQVATGCRKCTAADEVVSQKCALKPWR